ncbi:hypothetical protein [Niameybacter massiliensis]|nr:hypothetical protein [Niameybacter massiliensis]
MGKGHIALINPEDHLHLHGSVCPFALMQKGFFSEWKEKIW